MRGLLRTSVLSLALVVVGPGAGATVSSDLQLDGNPGASPAAVACATALSCVVVGTTSAKAVAVHWTPGTLRPISILGQVGRGANELSGVACHGGTCVAVGRVSTASAWTTPRVDVLRGGTVSTRTLPSAVPGPNGLDAVDCVSASTCTAVGDQSGGTAAINQAAITTLTFSANGALTATTPAHPTPGRLSSLSAVSCPTLGTCVAVGATFDGSTWTPLVEQQSGATWTVVPTSSLGTGYLVSVSCATSGSCVAVGSTTGLASPVARPIILAETSGIWGSTSLSLPGTALTSVSCWMPGQCRAVGVVGAAAARRPTSIVLGGNGWSIDHGVGLPAGMRSAQLSAVSCWNPGLCRMVGTATSATGVTNGIAEVTTAPVVLHLSPSTGSVHGGTIVTVTGVNLSRPSVVSFGTTRASKVVAVSPTELKVTAPARPAGAVSVTVRTAGGTSAATVASTFTYLSSAK